MKTPVIIQDLVGDIAHEQWCDHLELNPLPSGVCFLRVSVGERHFVMEYDPKQGAGVSENTPDSPAFAGHDEAFASLADAIRRFKELLARAATPSTAYAAMALHDKPI